jgi:hypothetical protein
MRGNLKRKEFPLFFLAIGALVGVGTYAVLVGSAKSDSVGREGTGAILQLVPGNEWINVARAFTDACGDMAPLKAQLIAEPEPGWIVVRVLTPEACAGITLSIPSHLIVVPSVLPIGQRPRS